MGRRFLTPRRVRRVVAVVRWSMSRRSVGRRGNQRLAAVDWLRIKGGWSWQSPGWRQSRQGGDRQRDPDQAFNVPDIAALVKGGEGNCPAGAAGPRGPTDAMD
ncbi:MAG: hypothetical protein AAB619_02620, partial [Patescibacteria group bacterium]